MCVLSRTSRNILILCTVVFVVFLPNTSHELVNPVQSSSSLEEDFKRALSDEFDQGHIVYLVENLGPLRRGESARCNSFMRTVGRDREYELQGRKSLHLGVSYYQNNRRYFDRAEYLYGVPPEVLLGMLRIETWFGKCAGGYNALPALFETYTIGAKSWNWFIDEARALVRYCLLKECDPNTLVSSSRGALGFPQFLPSNFFRFAVDGDGDGDINLFSDADAIISMANFLSSRGGWTHGINRKQQRRAVWKYNPTYQGYVDPVFGYANAIRPLLLQTAQQN